MTRRSIILSSSSSSDGGVNSAEQPPNTTIDNGIPELLLKLSLDDCGVNDGNDSQTSVSSLSHDDDEHDESEVSSTDPSSPSKPRSIFGSYWKAEGEFPSKQLSRPLRVSSPMGVMEEFQYQPPYSPTLDMLMVAQALHIIEGDVIDDADDDMNTYERTLRYRESPPDWRKQYPLLLASPYTSPPLWMSWFHQQQSASRCHQSAPSLLTSKHHSNLGGLSRARQMQSDSALITTPLKSALRQGRFGRFPTTARPTSTTTTNTATKCVSSDSHVHFQPMIQVCSFQPPVESWAAEGWSEWFGS